MHATKPAAATAASATQYHGRQPEARATSSSAAAHQVELSGAPICNDPRSTALRLRALTLAALLVPPRMRRWRALARGDGRCDAAPNAASSSGSTASAACVDGGASSDASARSASADRSPMLAAADTAADSAEPLRLPPKPAACRVWLTNDGEAPMDTAADAGSPMPGK